MTADGSVMGMGGSKLGGGKLCVVANPEDVPKRLLSAIIMSSGSGCSGVTVDRQGNAVTATASCNLGTEGGSVGSTVGFEGQVVENGIEGKFALSIKLPPNPSMQEKALVGLAAASSLNLKAERTGDSCQAESAYRPTDKFNTGTFVEDE